MGSRHCGRILMSSGIVPIVGAANVIRIAVAMGLVVGFAATAQAETKYNPYTKKWEDVSPDAVPQINPMTGKWELAPPNAQPKLNPYTNKYEMAPANAVPRFNPYTRQYEMAPPDARLELNTQTGTWHYVR